jgi:hypothetical protein
MNKAGLKLIIGAAAGLALAACASSEEANVASEGGAAAVTPVGRPSAEAEAVAAPAAVPDDQTLAPLTASGWGPLKIGMTLAEVTAALGPDSEPNAVGGADPQACDQFRPARAPEGLLVMMEQGRLTRISLIRDSKVRTDRNVGLGATAAAVRAAYPGSTLQSGPHKYEDKPAQYLVSWVSGGGPLDGAIPANSRGINHEVNAAGAVGAIHAGGPSILYVEGCS